MILERMGGYATQGYATQGYATQCLSLPNSVTLWMLLQVLYHSRYHCMC